MPDNNVIPVAMRAGPILALDPGASTGWSRTTYECGIGDTTVSFRLTGGVADLAHQQQGWLAARLDGNSSRAMLSKRSLDPAKKHGKQPTIEICGWAPDRDHFSASLIEAAVGLSVQDTAR